MFLDDNGKTEVVRILCRFFVPLLFFSNKSDTIFIFKVFSPNCN